MRIHSLWILGILFFAAGCGSSNGACGLLPVLPLAIHARSSTTGESLDANAALTIFSLQAPFDTSTGPLTSSPPSLPLVYFMDRYGTFHVRIAVSGYHQFDQDVFVE